MRINVFVARSTGVSRRYADELVAQGRVSIDSHSAKLGDIVSAESKVQLDGRVLSLPEARITLLFNKPQGYVVSRRGQGAKTIYELLPTEFGVLKPVGRLDLNSTGLLILTSDGMLAQELTHPGSKVDKVYQVFLDKPLGAGAQAKIEAGVSLEDGTSRLALSDASSDRRSWTVTMHEGRKRQIRRTFAHLGYEVQRLNRMSIGDYQLGTLKPGEYKQIDKITL